MGKSNFNFEMVMVAGDAGFQGVFVPSIYKFMTVINNSDNTIEVYQDQRTSADSDIRDQLLKVPYYNQNTVPIRDGQYFTFIYTNGGIVGQKKASFIFSEENLQINGSLSSPSSGGNVSLIADGVGLARQSQLPSALSGGNLKIAVMNASLPVVPSNTALTPLFVQANNIGSPDIPLCTQITLSTTAVALAATQAVSELLLQAEPSNTVDILIGNATAQVIRLQPGASVNLPVTDPAIAYAKASAAGSPVLNIFGRS